MTGAITNHLWQSTAFAAGAGLVAVMLRGNRARVRYWVWLCASAKFLIPFSILISLGSVLPVRTAAPAPQIVVITAEQVAEPFSQAEAGAAPARRSNEWVPESLAALWVCGFLGLVGLRIRGWARVRAAVRSSVAAAIASKVEVRTSPGLLEPGVVGFIRMILLLPEGIAERLTPAQLEAVLAHELSHARRRDNLTGALHMVVEAVFWFHPFVWWIGARLIEERERACDEAVLELGNEPRDYADAILGVVKLYVESPIVCVAGVTGADLKKRIEAILSVRAAASLSFAKKAALLIAGFAAIAAPVGVGMLSVRRLAAQQAPVPVPPPVQAQSSPPSPPGGRGRGPVSVAQQAPAPVAATAQSDPSLDWPAMTRIREQYGAPDAVEDRNTGTQYPSRIWRYSYLEDFHSNVELEFRAPGWVVRVNWPPPSQTYSGEPAIDSTLVDELARERRAKGEPVISAVAGFPGQHATMETYPAAVPQRLVVPGQWVDDARFVDVIAMISREPGSSQGGTPAAGTAVANLRDHIVFSQASIPNSASQQNWRYDNFFTLQPGSYVCNLSVAYSSGPIYSEAIHFTVR